MSQIVAMQPDKTKKAQELLASMKILKDIIAGSMTGEVGQSRFETDPDGVADQLLEFAEFAKNNLRAAGDPPDWRKFIGGTCMKATDLAPFIDMPFPWLIEPLLCRGFLTQIQGAPKGGKSAFALWVSLVAATASWNAAKEFYIPEGQVPLKVLYVAWEDPAILMAKRLSMYAVGMGEKKTFLPENITFIFAPTFFANREDHVEALSDAAREVGADIIVIDTLSYAHECEENAADQMRIPMGNLTQMAIKLNVAIMYVHHIAKGSKEKSSWERARGSAAIAAAWHILIDWGQREEGSDVNPVSVQSKLGVDALWNVEYQKIYGDKSEPHKITGVSWGVEPKEKKPKDNKGKSKINPETALLNAIAQLMPEYQPDGPPGKVLVEVLSHQGISRPTVYRTIEELQGCMQIVGKVVGKTTYYRATHV